MMKKLLTLFAFSMCLGLCALVLAGSIGPTQVMADTKASPCAQVEVTLDEGYGVSRSETRVECAMAR